jgi:PhnB protein
MSAKPVPHNAVIPHLVVRDAAKAIDFYKAAFGAEEVCRHHLPDGKTIMHAEIKFGDIRLFLGEEAPQWGCTSPLLLGNTSVVLHLYVKDVDAAVARAARAGATVTMPPADMFWGDRFGKVTDPFGHQWGMATHVKDLTDAEIAAAGREFFKNMAAHK